uniref:Cyclin B n=1 Tax=Palaemon carinicauda TaxID=392227 RepID=A0A0E3JLL7_PALCI|nr:cyclin B [Palaemon carinicauda]
MAMRTSNLQTGILRNDENGPRKVSTKVLQGPILRRAALGDMGNRAVPFKGPTVPVKPDFLKQSLVSRAVAARQISSQIRKETKENEVKEPTENVENMDVQEAKVEELAIAFSSQLLNVEDIDSQDHGNPQLVSEYVNEIYKYLRELEDRCPVKNAYLEGQVINGKMRLILIDWLIQVHSRFTLLQETLFLTVSIIDRFLQVERNIPRNKLQLVGVTAMFIASKYEEMYCPEIGDFSYITDKAYTKTDIKRMEIQMLKKLQFNVSYPLPLHFLRRNSKAGSVDATQHTLAKYLMELCLLEYSMVHFKPSIIAAAALCLSLKLSDGSDWNNTLIYYSRYTEEQLIPVMAKMASVVVKSYTMKQQAVRQKYKASKYMKISDIPQLKSKIIQTLAEKSSLT